MTKITTKTCYWREIGLLFGHNTQIVAHLLCRQRIWHPFTYNIYLCEIFLYAFIVSKLY